MRPLTTLPPTKMAKSSGFGSIPENGTGNKSFSSTISVFAMLSHTIAKLFAQTETL